MRILEDSGEPKSLVYAPRRRRNPIPYVAFRLSSILDSYEMNALFACGNKDCLIAKRESNYIILGLEAIIFRSKNFDPWLRSPTMSKSPSVSTYIGELCTSSNRFPIPTIVVDLPLPRSWHNVVLPGCWVACRGFARSTIFLPIIISAPGGTMGR